jgi:hypothetical protein
MGMKEEPREKLGFMVIGKPFFRKPMRSPASLAPSLQKTNTDKFFLFTFSFLLY